MTGVELIRNTAETTVVGEKTRYCCQIIMFHAIFTYYEQGIPLSIIADR